MGLFNKFKNIFKSANKEELKSYDEALSKTRNYFTDKISLLNGKYKKVNDEYFEQLEEILIMADIGVNTVVSFIDKLKKRVRSENITNSEDLKDIIVDEMFIIYLNNEIVVNKINYNTKGPTVILFVGVNGVGKTTTIGKLAYRLKQENKSVLMVAADTFRAGAKEQLKKWGDQTLSSVISLDNTDPASVVYEGVKKAIEKDIDVVLIDTAGRLQNKSNLMEELAKIKISTNKNPIYTEIIIEDDGGGIKVENFKKIFERFYKSPDSKGFGIGLAMAKSIIEANNGDISVKNGKDGAIFKIKFYNVT